MGAIFGGGLALAFQDSTSPLLLPLMLVAGVVGGMLWAAIPAFLRTRFNANEILTSLMLVYVATLTLSLLVHGAWRDPEGFNFPQSKMFGDAALSPILLPGDAAQRRAAAGARRRRAGLALHAQEPGRLPDARRGTCTRRRQLRRHFRAAHRVARHADRRRLRGTRRRERGGRSDRPAAAVGVARLRLRRDHRRVRRPAASGRHRVREPAHVASLPRRRIGADQPGAARRPSPDCSRARCCSSCSPRTSSSTIACVVRRPRAVATAAA